MLPAKPPLYVATTSSLPTPLDLEPIRSWGEPIRHPSGWTYLWFPSADIVGIPTGGITTEDAGQATPTVDNLIQITRDEVFQRLRLSGLDLESDLELYYPAVTGVHATRPTEVYAISHEHNIAVVFKLSVIHKIDSKTGPVTQKPTQNMRKMYWKYMEQHPAHHPPKRLQKIATEGVTEAVDYLAWCSQAALLSTGTPHSTFSLTHSKELTQLLTRLQTRVELGAKQQKFRLDPHSVLVLMTAGVLSNMHHFYNEKGFWTQGRVDFIRDPDAFNNPKFLDRLVDIWVSITAVILLFTPYRYLKNFEEIKRLFLPVEEWQRHLQKLTDEWQSFNLLATVMLAAASSFISVEKGTTAVTAAAISALCALGSVLSGLYCLAYYRAYVSTPGDGMEQAAIIDRYQNNLFDHGANRRKYFSIILAFPEALLLWSIISFIVAILAFNLKGGFSPGVIFVLGVAGVVVMAAVLIFATMWYLWGKGSIWTRVFKLRRAEVHVLEDVQIVGVEKEKHATGSRGDDSGHLHSEEGESSLHPIISERLRIEYAQHQADSQQDRGYDLGSLRQEFHHVSPEMQRFVASLVQKGSRSEENER